MNYEMLVNKDNPLAKDFEPYNLVKIDSDYKDGLYLNKKAYEQFLLLKEYALEYGYRIDIMSAYRDYEYQNKIFNDLVLEKGYNYAYKYIAKPGLSEHQTGLAIDICVYRDDACYIEHDILELIETSFVHSNCHKYGFILRYPKNSEDITKYNYEPWHLRYVGDIASYLYNNDLTMEEYYLNK